MTKTALEKKIIFIPNRKVSTPDYFSVLERENPSIYWSLQGTVDHNVWGSSHPAYREQETESPV